MYYFAVKSGAYRSISRHVPGPSSATAGWAYALLRQWATRCRCASNSTLLRQAEEDWAGLSHDSQPLFPGRDDLPDDLDEVLVLMERDPHLPEVRDIPLPLPFSRCQAPTPTTLPPRSLVEIPTAPRVPPPKP